jgi:hypothetical protein
MLVVSLFPGIAMASGSMLVTVLGIGAMISHLFCIVVSIDKIKERKALALLILATGLALLWGWLSTIGAGTYLYISVLVILVPWAVPFVFVRNQRASRED